MKIIVKSTIALVTFFSVLLLSNPHSHASHWLECKFEVKIMEVSPTHIRLSPRRFLGGDGSVMMTRRSCLQAIGNRTVAMAEVNQGANLLRRGVLLQGRWSEYGAMSPTGPISSRGWSFTPLKPQ
ncbi:MAG: hypothetical protein ACXITR_06870 [Cyanobacterium sp.]